MWQLLRLLSVFLLVFASHQAVQAQCPATCTFTAPSGGTSFNLNGNQILCITGNVGDLNLNISGTGNVICVAPGVTWTQTNGISFNGGTTINVFGTFNMNGGYNFNSAVVVNVRAGGTLNTNTGGFNSNLTMNNEGTVNFTSTGAINNQGTFTFNNLTTTATLSATATTLFKFGNGNSVENAGIMTFSNLENEEAIRFANFSTGRITIGRYFFNHGNIINEGLIQTICGAFGTIACQFIVGNKGPGKEFRNASGGCVRIAGNVTFDGPGFNDGNITITAGSSGGNLTLNNTLSGSNGVLIVESGVSTIGAAGSYRGTNMKFCDRNTAGGNFDAISANSVALNNYTIDCTVQSCTGPTAQVATVCPPQLCPDVTLIRN